VQATLGRDHFLEGGVDSRRIRDVEALRHGGAAHGDHRGRRFGRRSFVAGVVEHDLGAQLAQRHADGAADTTRSARHQRDLSR